MPTSEWLLCVIVTGFVLIGMVHIDAWRSEESLWTAALVVSPQSDRARVNRLKARQGQP